MKEEIKGVSVEQKTSPLPKNADQIPGGDKIYQSLLQEFYLLQPKAACRIKLGAWWHAMWFLSKLWLHFISTNAQQNTPRKNPGQESRQICISSGSERKKWGQVMTPALVPEEEGSRLDFGVKSAEFTTYFFHYRTDNNHTHKRYFQDQWHSA